MPSATSNNIAIPNSMGDAPNIHVKNCRLKKGTDIDNAYIDMMLEDHVNNMEKF